MMMRTDDKDTIKFRTEQEIDVFGSQNMKLHVHENSIMDKGGKIRASRYEAFTASISPPPSTLDPRDVEFLLSFKKPLKKKSKQASSRCQKQPAQDKTKQSS